MNSNSNLNWPQASIDDIITQCESLSLSSSETDNITLDSGIFFDNKVYSKLQHFSPCDAGSMYHMLNSEPVTSSAPEPAPPPPPPYNSSHNIISRNNLQSSEVCASFQTATTNIPYYHEKNKDGTYLTSVDGSLPRFYSNREKVIHHSRKPNNCINDNSDRVSSVVPKIPCRQRMSCVNYSNESDNQMTPDKCASRPLSVFTHHKNGIIDDRVSHEFDPVADSKILGMCNKCQYTVTDSESACIALGKLYHSACFVCSYCNRSLRGKVFYKDQVNVYCEKDYMVFGFHKSSKICIACGHIITDSILEALGKDFHPRCFKCSICDKCLDGIPFTVDQNNNIYCIPDYHLTFAPRCAICCQSITPCNDSENVVRVVVNDRDFHVDCYRCQACFRTLTNDSNCFVWTTDRSSSSVKLLCRQCYGDKFRELSRQHQQH